MKKFTPLHDHVLVEPITPADTTDTGGVVKSSALPSSGTVRAAGPGRIEIGQLSPVSVEEGDIVHFDPYKGGQKQIVINGINYYIIRESELVGFEREEYEIDNGEEL
jgi:co-chaperonin GroES (HSP10)